MDNFGKSIMSHYIFGILHTRYYYYYYYYYYAVAANLITTAIGRKATTMVMTMIVIGLTIRKKAFRLVMRLRGYSAGF